MSTTKQSPKMLLSKEEFDRRFIGIWKLMGEQALEALIVYAIAHREFLGNTRYFTNCPLITRRHYVVIPLGRDPILLVPDHTDDRPRKYSVIEDIRCIGDGHMAEMPVEIVKILRDLKLERGKIGIVGMENLMPVRDFLIFKEGLPQARFLDATDLLNRFRMKKSLEEIELVKKAGALVDEAYRTFLEMAHPGEREFDIIAEVKKVLTKGGAEDIFMITTSGPSIIGLLEPPTSRMIEKGDVFLFNCELAGEGGYWAEIERPVAFSDIRSDFWKVFEVAKEAVRAGIEIMKPGHTAGEVATRVINFIKEAGCETGHWCGHGMGLDVVEEPGLIPKNETMIEENMVISLHPHVRIPGGVGLMLGDTFIIETEGAKRISKMISEFRTI